MVALAHMLNRPVSRNHHEKYLEREKNDSNRPMRAEFQ